MRLVPIFQGGFLCVAATKTVDTSTPNSITQKQFMGSWCGNILTLVWS